MAKCGYDGIRSVTSAVIDYYGASGFSKEMRLTGEELDEHFGVPVVDTVEAMTAELQRALHAEMRNLLTPALTNLPHATNQALGADTGVPNLVAENVRGKAPRKRDRPRVECSSDGAGAVAPADNLATEP